jgi:hypothetical protein
MLCKSYAYVNVSAEHHCIDVEVPASEAMACFTVPHFAAAPAAAADLSVSVGKFLLTANS